MSDPPERSSLVSTEWVAAHLEDPLVAVVEVDVDTALYDEGHIPGAVGWSWRRQLSDPVRRDILGRQALECLMSAAGIAREATVVLYGDTGNWFAAWAFWQLAVYGHPDLRIMDGGRHKWQAEGRPLTPRPPHRGKAQYRASEADRAKRALLRDVQAAVATGGAVLLDVRSPEEYSGEVLAPPGLAEGCQRGGHIPGAHNVPWRRAMNAADCTFRSPDELRRLYTAHGIVGDTPVITYCRIGERSSLTWFVLTHLLGMPDVRNYDGSWTEWGNLVGVPVVQGHAP